MDYKKWGNIIKIILLKIVEELEKSAKNKSDSGSNSMLNDSIYSSVKFIVLEQVDSLVDEAVAFTKKQIEDLSLLIAQKLSVILASLVYILLILAIALLFFLFLSISLAIYLGQLLESPALGFLAVGGLVFIVLIVLYWSGRNVLKNKIKETLVSYL